MSDDVIGITMRDAILAILKKHKVTNLNVAFQGSGDSGNIEEMTYQAKGSKGVEINADLRDTKWAKGNKDVARFVAAGLQIEESRKWDGKEWKAEFYTEENAPSFIEFLEDYCYESLSEHSPGWEIDDGSDGGFTFNPETEEVSLSISEIIRQYNEYPI